MEKAKKLKRRTKPGHRQVSIVVPITLLEKIAFVLSERVINKPRQTWMLEAMSKEVEREIEIIESGGKL